MARGNLGHNAALDDFIGNLAASPLRDGSASVRGGCTGEGNDLAALLSTDLDGSSGARHIAEPLVQRELGERNGREGEPAGAPAADGIDIQVEEAGDLGVIGAISSGKDDASTQGKLLRERMATQQPLQFLAQVRRKLDRWRFWTSHGTASHF